MASRTISAELRDAMKQLRLVASPSGRRAHPPGSMILAIGGPMRVASGNPARLDCSTAATEWSTTHRWVIENTVPAG
jgi:hypothetical protein